MKRVVVAGAGYVGLATAACFVRLGHDVCVVDVNDERIDELSRGRIPFYEPGLEDLIASGLSKGSLRFTCSYPDALEEAEVMLVCVPTSDNGRGVTDLSMVEASVKAALDFLRPYSLIAVKSTVPAGTCRILAQLVGRRDIDVVSNPEFLQAGRAVAATLAPSRIVIGAESDEVASRMKDLYKGLDAPIVLTDPTSAELIKLASNAYLAVRLSFVNEIAAMAEHVGADINGVFQGIGADPRIGPDFLQPGPGWGGSCLPKDARMLSVSAAEASGMPVVEAALVSNTDRLERIVKATVAVLPGAADGRRVALLGLAFKAGTDDLRESPALFVADQLVGKGIQVVAYDPMVAALHRDDIELASTAVEAAHGAHALVVVTGCPEFKDLVYEELAAVMAGRHVVDACRVIEPEAVHRAGLEYVVAG